MKKEFILPLLALTCIIALLIYGPIHQNADYHNFADQRKMLGIPNFLNVITNLPFAIVAVYGVWQIRNMKEKKLKRIALTLFISFLLVTLGSGYYHWQPNNYTLVYDRIPITIIIMSFFSFLIYDFINVKKGYTSFFILNLIGIMSVVYWHLGDAEGRGDLRWYALVQFFPVIAIPVLLSLYKSPVNYRKPIILIFLFFALAKLVEGFDKRIYELLDQTISGHSLKHLLMAGVGYEIVRVMTRRGTKATV